MGRRRTRTRGSWVGISQGQQRRRQTRQEQSRGRPSVKRAGRRGHGREGAALTKVSRHDSTTARQAAAAPLHQSSLDAREAQMLQLGPWGRCPVPKRAAARRSRPAPVLHPNRHIMHLQLPFLRQWQLFLVTYPRLGYTCCRRTGSTLPLSSS